MVNLVQLRLLEPASDRHDRLLVRIFGLFRSGLVRTFGQVGLRARRDQVQVPLLARLPTFSGQPQVLLDGLDPAEASLGHIQGPRPDLVVAPDQPVEHEGRNETDATKYWGHYMSLGLGQ